MFIPRSTRRSSVLAALFLFGCGQTPEKIVTSTRHCTEVTLDADLMMRLSSYSGYPDSTEQWVVQVCHPTGTACSPILTYDHAPPPVYSLEGDRITVELLGGNLQKHVDTVTVGRTYRIRTHVITGYVSPKGIEAFQRKVRHRCPPGNQQYPH